MKFFERALDGIDVVITFLGSYAEIVLFGLFFFGAFYWFRFLRMVCRGIFKHFIRPRKDLRKRYGASRKESWALVTGSAMGIGKAYSLELAKTGFNIVMIDKEDDKMETTKKELEALGVKVKTLSWDFGNLLTLEKYQKLEKELNLICKDLDIGILINNAAEFQHEALDEISPDNLLRASVVNCHAPALLARYFIPKMVERHQKGSRSAIINVGGNGGELHNPSYKFAVFGATKAYVHALSVKMEEVWGNKIDIMTVIPRQTKTFTCCVDYCFTSTPEIHAKAVMDQLGYEKITYGPLMHDFEYQLRFNNPFAFFFDKLIQCLNRKENEKVVIKYQKRCS